MHVCNLFIFIQVIQTQKQKSSENYSSFCLEEQLGDFCASLHVGMLKVAFFQKVWFVFLNPQISKKKIFQKTILSLKFKFQVQDSFLKYIFLEIWRFEKHIALSEKKPPLAQPPWLSQVDQAQLYRISTLVKFPAVYLVHPLLG